MADDIASTDPSTAPPGAASPSQSPGSEENDPAPSTPSSTQVEKPSSEESLPVNGSLEERLRRLEMTVADPRQLEERVIRKVFSRLDRRKVAAERDTRSDGETMEKSAAEPPKAKPAPPPLAVVAPP